MKLKKAVVVINGAGGVGKDTLCDMTAKHLRVMNVSSITPIKEIASANGWGGKKTDKDREFLSNLKRVFTDYNDLPTRYLKEKYDEFMDSEDIIMFTHIREGEEIDKFKRAVGGDVTTVLVERDLGRGTYGNKSDDGVDDYEYDFYFDNNGTLEESEEKFLGLLQGIIMDS